MKPTPGAEVLHGDEATLRVGLAMLRRAHRLDAIIAPAALEEFGPVLAEEMRALHDRGGRLRVLTLGPVAPEVRDVMHHAGAQLRILASPREVGFLATNDELMLFTHQPLDSPLVVCAIRVADDVAVAHFRVAFEDAWEASA